MYLFAGAGTGAGAGAGAGGALLILWQAANASREPRVTFNLILGNLQSEEIYIIYIVK